MTSEHFDTLYLQSDHSPCQECAMSIESRFAVTISAEVGLRVGLPRHMQNQFFVHIVYSDYSLGSDTAHQLNIHITLHYSTSNPLCGDAGDHLCYVRLPQALCVHCSDVPLTGLAELCSSALLWLCLTSLHFNFYMFSSRHGVDLACVLICLCGVVSSVPLSLLHPLYYNTEAFII